jgi:WD40 repeat protein
LSTIDLTTRLLDDRTVDPENPWPGLLPFNEADRTFFRGRVSEIEDLARLSGRARLAILCGLSGIGKSSLLKAGLFPKLRRHRILPVYIRLDFKSQPLHLAAQVLDAIALHSAVARIEAPAPPTLGDTLWEYFHRKDNDFWDERNEPCTPLLVFDQWEEIFTLGRSTPDCAEATSLFLDEFADLAEGAVPAVVKRRLKSATQAEQFAFDRHPYKILLSVRADFLADLENLAPRISGLAINRMYLQRMSGEAGLLVVNQAPHLIDPNVAQQVVRFVGAARSQHTPLSDLEIEPALLSLVCRELNEKRKQLGLPKITADLLEGNLEGVLRNFYEESFAGLSSAVRPFVEENLLNAENFRDSVSMANVRRAPGVIPADIDHLIDRRLVRVENLGGERLELTHDRLTDVVRASRDARRAAELRASEEEQQNRERQEAEAARSLAEQAARRNLIVAAILLVFALAAGGLAFYALRQRAEAVRQSKIADDRHKDADLQRTEAERQRHNAEDERAKAEIQRKMAVDNQRKEADAKKAALEAEKRTAKALKAEQEARQDADAKTIIAKKAADDAEAAKTATQKSAHDAAVSAENLAKTNAQLTAKSTELGKRLAQSDVSEAVRRLALQRPAEALAYLARALGNDPDSLAARSLVFDILLRGRLKIPDAWSARTNLASFDHSPHDLGVNVFSAVFDPAGSRILATAGNGLARLIPPTSNPTDFRSGNQPVNSGAFSPDGKLIALALQNNTVQIRNLATGKTVILKHDGPVMSASFSHQNGKLRVVTASWDKTARIWDAETGAQQNVFYHKSPVTSASFSGNDRQAVTSAWNNEAVVWDAVTGTPLGKPLVHGGSGSSRESLKIQVNSAAFDPASGRVVTAGSDHFARVWDWQTGQPVGKPLQHDGEVNSAAFDVDGLRIVTASSDGTARVWEAETGEPISLPLKHNGPVMSAVFSPDGLRILTASFDNRVRVWEVRSSASLVEAALLQQFAEYAGGFDVAALPALKPLSNPQDALNKIRAQIVGPAANSTAAAAIQWFASRRN